MDKTHFNTFILSSADKLYYYIYGILKHPEESFETVSDTILHSWEQRKKLSHTELTPVFKTARDFAKKKLGQRINEIKADLEELKFSEDAILSRFCMLTRELSPIQSEIMCLRAVVRLTLDEISMVVDLGINSVQSILASVRKEIRSKIHPLGNHTDYEENEILKKYYSGISTIDEEEQLRLYFAREDMAKSTEADCELFQLFLEIGKAEMPAEYAKELRKRVYEVQNKGWLNRLFR